MNAATETELTARLTARLTKEARKLTKGEPVDAEVTRYAGADSSWVVYTSELGAARIWDAYTGNGQYPGRFRKGWSKMRGSHYVSRI